MKKKTALIIILSLAIAGLIFSGYLSYYTLLGPGCHKALISCGSKPVKILGVPQCVYGFIMYLALLSLASLALKKDDRKSLLKAIMIIAVVGVLFAGTLSVYELFIVETGIAGLPACVYGFFVYLLILIFSTLGLRDKEEGQLAIS